MFEDGSGKMSVSRDKIHEYLGMTMDYTVSGQLRISMISYIKVILAEFDKEELKGNGTKSISAPNNIFVVNKDRKKLKHRQVV